MPSIREFLTSEHRSCDDIFAKMENAVASESPEAQSLFEAFYDDVLDHFSKEEIVVFPALDNKMGERDGPTVTMTIEHEQMRALLSRLSKALESGDTKQFLGLSETLMLLMQQHNMKEEQMLYALMDQQLEDDSGFLISQMRNF